MGKENLEAKKAQKKLDKIEKVSNDAGKKLSNLGDTISGSVASMLSGISAASHNASQSNQSGAGQEESSVPAIPTEGINQFNASLAAANETMAVSLIPSINDMVNTSLIPMAGQFVALNPQVQGFVDNLALAAPSIGATISTLGEMSTTISG
ncbi:MAG: hypothetical protein MJA31_15130, partial [Clostridia bacterium]|nr:hypothetical protein [Clostridia bacterium]